MTRDDLLEAAREALAETAPDRVAEVSPLVDVPVEGELSAAHETVAETQLVAAIDAVFTAQLGERAAAAIEAFGKKRTMSKIYQVFLYGTMSTADREDGKGSCKKRLGIACPSCQKRECVDYIGSDVEEGSLEFVHLIHTEVRDWFVCSLCGHEYSEYQHI
jgi:hypothetical protein